MSEQFNDINSFKAYQKTIYEYINTTMIQVPLFFENQNAVNNVNLPSNTSTVGGNFQQTIRDGQVVRGKKVDEIFISFDDVYSNNQGELNIITHIANKLGGLTPHPDIIDVDAFIYEGGNGNGLSIPVSLIDEVTLNSLENYVYIPYVDLKNVNEKLLLNFDSGVDTLFQYFTNLNIPNADFENFKSQLLSQQFNLSVKKYNLSDNTSNFLPVGVQKRQISKKVLKDNSETTISELVPETDEYQIRQFFKLWDKTKGKITSGQEFIEGSTFLNAGNFAGGIGPGNYNLWLNTNTDGTPINNITPPPVDYQYFEQNEYLPNNNLWDPQNQASAIASQRVIEEENPGLSSFVYTTQRNAPVWYTIDINDIGNNFKPGVSYTLSGWQTQDNEFNQSNYEELTPGHFFFFKLDAVMNDDTLIPVIEFPSFNLVPEEFLPLIKGQPVEVWQGSEKLWTRYKKTFTIPVSDDNQPIDSSGTIIDEFNWTGNYKLTWFLGYQNSIEIPASPAQIYNGALLGGGIQDTSEESNIWDGPTLRSNTNFASQYYTGLRLNVGEQITGITKLPLQNIGPRTIARVLQDCIKLLEPDFPQRNIPIYSDAKLQELILSQQNTALISTTLTEIKQGLIVALKNIVDGISDTYNGVAQSLLDASDGQEQAVLTQLAESFRVMIENTEVKQQLIQLENAIQSAFSAVTTNFTGVVNPANINAYYQNLSTINEYGAPGFKLFNDGGQDVYGVHLGVGILESESGNFNASLTQNIYVNEVGLADGGFSLGGYNHPDESIIGFPEYFDIIHFFLNTGQNISTIEQGQAYVEQGRHDFFMSSFQGQKLRNLVEEFTSPFINVEKLRYRITAIDREEYGPSFFDENSTDYATNIENFVEPINNMTTRFGGQPPYVGQAYTNGYFNETIKKYLYKNTSTPIGAFYTSEMMTDGYNSATRKGSPASYLAKPNNYPSVGYGPYSATNLDIDNYQIQDFGFENGIERTKNIYEAYMSRYAENNALFVQNDEPKQFEGLQSLFNNRSQLYQAVETSEYFEELETYTLDFYSGIDFMGFVYTRLFEDDPMTGYGYTNIDVGAGNDVKLSNGIQQGLSYFESPDYAREDFFHFANPTADGDGFYRGGKITMRFYEPHWEWNPLQGFVFRLAQPVIGSEHGPETAGGNYPGETVTNSEIESGIGNFKFEKKFKFKKMAFFTKEG